MGAVGAVDIGQTGARVRLVDGAWSRDLSASGHTSDVAIEVTVGRVLGAAADAWGDDVVIERLALGLTGVHGRVPDAAALRGVLPPAWTVGELRAIDDSLAAHLAAFAGEAGTVLMVGTGVVALAWDGAGPWVHGEGRGPLLGDRGGGFWIGSQGLRAVCRTLDGVDPTTVLVERAIERFGPVDRWSAELGWRAASVPRVAAFCVEVMDAAGTGDAVARTIVRDAVAELAQTTIATARRAGVSRAGSRFSMVGNVMRAGAIVVDPWVSQVQAIEPSMRYAPTIRSSIDALVDLARGPIPPGFEVMVGHA